MPFTCSYCGDSFCGEHRIPERHACPESWRAKVPRDATPMIAEKWSDKPSYAYTVSYRPKPSRVFRFSKTELKHLAIGVLLVMGVGFSYFLSSVSNIIDLSILSIAFTLSFLLHELAHKFSAQYFKLWAEFRLTMQGALITLISIFLPFKLISPGAVMLSGSGTRENVGKTAISGPIINIIISTVCIIIAVFSQYFFIIVAFINALLAVFNLIPFGVLDGLKVFRWNKIVWTVTFAGAIILIAYTYGIMY
jgi:Zn-dependent protease